MSCKRRAIHRVSSLIDGSKDPETLVPQVGRAGTKRWGEPVLRKSKSTETT
ncbi:MAG: hypothetical protein QW130_04435 [Sulfolobales archaeon]